MSAATESAAGDVHGSGTCDSCGRPADDLVGVHRAYLTPDDGGRLVLGEVEDETERWCGSCRSHYPHVPVRDEGTPEASGGGPTPVPG